MLRHRTMCLFKTPLLRTQRNRVMPAADVTPAATFTWTGITWNDTAYIYPQVQLTGVNKQVTFNIVMTNDQMTAYMTVQGSNIPFVDANASTYGIAGGASGNGASKDFRVSPGQYCILEVDSIDPSNSQTTTITLTNKLSGATIASFNVTLIPPV